MARETKVGLLAGLAFIICFAVILANRGQTRRYSADTGLQPSLQQRLAPRQDESTRAANADIRGESPSTIPTKGTTPRSPAASLRAQRQANRIPQRVDAPGPTASGSEVDWTTAVDAGRERDESQPARSVDGSAADGHDAAARNQLADTTLTAFNADPDKASAALRALLARRAGGSATWSGSSAPRSNGGDAASSTTSLDNTASTMQQRGRTADRSSNSRQYRVSAGDTLTAIARHAYGSSERRILDAILDANRATLSNPDRLKVGMALVLPQVNGTAPTPQVVEPKSEQPAKLVADRVEARSGTRWYQVRTDDRYVSIAREQLGDASRWRELHELNRDKFPNPDQIREGVRIKLPSK